MRSTPEREALKRYGERLKKLRETREPTPTWAEVAKGTGIPLATLQSWAYGKRPITDDGQAAVRAYFGADAELDRLLSGIHSGRATSASSNSSLASAWGGRWFQAIGKGPIEWNGESLERDDPTLDVVELTTFTGKRFRGEIERVEGPIEEVGERWLLEGRVVVEDATLLMVFVETDKSCDESRGVIAMRRDGQRKRHLIGVYTKYWWPVGGFVPFPLDWYRSDPRGGPKQG